MQCLEYSSSEARWLAPLLATLCRSATYRPSRSARHSVNSNPAQHSSEMFAVAAALAAAPLVMALYAYMGYPALLWSVTRVRRRQIPATAGGTWPTVTVTVPVFNAASSIRATLEGIVGLEYPSDKLQLLVLSDASTDGTDDIVGEFAGRGVELLRAPERRGKTAAENDAIKVARGEIVVNVDATVVVPPGSLKRLVRVFDDPTVGVASGRDISFPAKGLDGTRAESSYVGYEMWLRDLETQVGSIVGASGCFYAIRRCIHDRPIPGELSWDFASPLVAREKGYRSVSVRDAVCLVPRTPQIQSEVRRKVRTMARGIRTLFYHRSLMNPFRYGGFALMLISHKLLRWLPYLVLPLSILALGFLATRSAIGMTVFILVIIALGLGSSGFRHSAWSRLRPIAASAFFVAALAAGFLAWCDVLRGVRMATWEPTHRPDPGTTRMTSAG
jgi:cellulose synthase/poly-beta-1,6-N-acetylglucosamine synthase-like glycosyltransferase